MTKTLEGYFPHLQVYHSRAGLIKLAIIGTVAFAAISAFVAGGFVAAGMFTSVNTLFGFGGCAVAILVFVADILTFVIYPYFAHKPNNALSSFSSEDADEEKKTTYHEASKRSGIPTKLTDEEEEASFYHVYKGPTVSITLKYPQEFDQLTPIEQIKWFAKETGFVAFGHGIALTSSFYALTEQSQEITVFGSKYNRIHDAYSAYLQENYTKVVTQDQGLFKVLSEVFSEKNPELLKLLQATGNAQLIYWNIKMKQLRNEDFAAVQTERNSYGRCLMAIRDGTPFEETINNATIIGSVKTKNYYHHVSDYEFLLRRKQLYTSYAYQSDEWPLSDLSDVKLIVAPLPPDFCNETPEMKIQWYAQRDQFIAFSLKGLTAFFPDQEASKLQITIEEKKFTDIVPFCQGYCRGKDLSKENIDYIAAALREQQPGMMKRLMHTQGPLIELNQDSLTLHKSSKEVDLNNLEFCQLNLLGRFLMAIRDGKEFSYRITIEEFESWFTYAERYEQLLDQGDIYNIF